MFIDPLLVALLYYGLSRPCLGMHLSVDEVEGTCEADRYNDCYLATALLMPLSVDSTSSETVMHARACFQLNNAMTRTMPFLHFLFKEKDISWAERMQAEIASWFASLFEAMLQLTAHELATARSSQPQGTSLSEPFNDAKGDDLPSGEASSGLCLTQLRDDAAVDAFLDRLFHSSLFDATMKHTFYGSEDGTSLIKAYVLQPMRQYVTAYFQAPRALPLQLARLTRHSDVLLTSNFVRLFGIVFRGASSMATSFERLADFFVACASHLRHPDNSTLLKKVPVLANPNLALDANRSSYSLHQLVNLSKMLLRYLEVGLEPPFRGNFFADCIAMQSLFEPFQPCIDIALSYGIQGRFLLVSLMLQRLAELHAWCLLHLQMLREPKGKTLALTIFPEAVLSSLEAVFCRGPHMINISGLASCGRALADMRLMMPLFSIFSPPLPDRAIIITSADICWPSILPVFHGLMLKLRATTVSLRDDAEEIQVSHLESPMALEAALTELLAKTAAIQTSTKEVDLERHLIVLELQMGLRLLTSRGQKSLTLDIRKASMLFHPSTTLCIQSTDVLGAYNLSFDFGLSPKSPVEQQQQKQQEHEHEQQLQLELPVSTRRRIVKPRRQEKAAALQAPSSSDVPMHHPGAVVSTKPSSSTSVPNAASHLEFLDESLPVVKGSVPQKSDDSMMMSSRSTSTATIIAKDKQKDKAVEELVENFKKKSLEKESMAIEYTEIFKDLRLKLIPKVKEEHAAVMAQLKLASRDVREARQNAENAVKLANRKTAEIKSLSMELKRLHSYSSRINEE